MESKVIIPAVDGLELVGSLFTPEGPAKAAVVLASATGVPRRIYTAFAEHLSQHGFSIVTFDYRGIGDSLQGHVKHSRAGAQDWGVLDLDGVLQWMRSRHPDIPLLHFGHSIGGQLLGLAPHNASVDGVVLVAAQSGYWGHWSGSGRARMLFVWYALIPVLSHALGYLPMKRVSGGENLPKGVALEWARWGRDARYILINRIAKEERSFERVKRRILAFSFSDDTFAPRPAVQTLVDCFVNATSTHKHLHPKDVGEKVVGHFSSFKPRFEKTLWKEYRDALESLLSAAPRADGPGARHSNPA